MSAEEIRYLKARIERLELIVLAMYNQTGNAPKLVQEMDSHLYKSGVRNSYEIPMQDRLEWQR